MDTECNKPDWQCRKNRKNRAKLFGYPDRGQTTICGNGEYMAIDHSRLVLETELEPLSPDSGSNN